MTKAGIALAAVAIVYGVAQLTIGQLLRSNLDDFASQVAAAPAGSDGAVGPLPLRSSDLCTLLTDPGMLKGWANRIAYPEAGWAASRLKQRYRFEAIDGCSKYRRYNSIVAHPVTG